MAKLHIWIVKVKIVCPNYEIHREFVFVKSGCALLAQQHLHVHITWASKKTLMQVC